MVALLASSLRARALLVDCVVDKACVRDTQSLKVVAVDGVALDRRLGRRRVAQHRFRVDGGVRLERRLLVEPRGARLALERLLSCVRAHVALKLVLGVEQFIAVRALVSVGCFGV